MNEWLESLLDRLGCPVERPDISLEAKAGLHVELVLVVEQHHPLPYITTRCLEPLGAELGHVDQDRSHLSRLD